MQCALCLEFKKLQRSHIVPDFIFSKLLGEEHEFYVVGTTENPKKYESTFREKLLCQSCEQLFGKWESHASRFFYGGMALEGEVWGKHSVIRGADYAQMKLFYMSLLWRFGVTTIPWFRRSFLNESHRERLRLMLLNSDPGEPWRYGCRLTAVTSDRRFVHDLIVPPMPFRIGRERWCHIVVGGFLLTFYGSSHVPIGEELHGMITESGELILTPREMRDIDFLVVMKPPLSDLK